MKPMLILAAVIVLSACQRDTGPDADPPLACGAGAMQSLVGQPLAAVDRATLQQPYRIIGPDMAVTMDWNPERLNIEHDASETITRISCG